jgi:hypothetical protein
LKSGTTTASQPAYQDLSLGNNKKSSEKQLHIVEFIAQAEIPEQLQVCDELPGCAVGLRSVHLHVHSCHGSSRQLGQNVRHGGYFHRQRRVIQQSRN